MTQTAKHTPAPWQIEGSGEEVSIVNRDCPDDFAWDIATVHSGTANAALIAAAPETAAERDHLKALNEELAGALKQTEKTLGSLAAHFTQEEAFILILVSKVLAKHKASAT